MKQLLWSVAALAVVLAGKAVWSNWRAVDRAQEHARIVDECWDIMARPASSADAKA